MKIIFFGTPEYVVPVLDELHKRFKSRKSESPIAAVVTQEPKPTGREQKLGYSAVDNWAFKKKIPIIFEPQKIIGKVDADLGILASFGAIIPSEVINYFPYGILNIHPSLLPKFRGASPVQATILSGDVITGSTIMKLDAKLDHGSIVAQFKEEVMPDDTTVTLRERLFLRSAEVLGGLIEPYLKGKINIKEQNHDEATFTKQIKKEDAFIPPKIIASVIKGKTPKAKLDIGFMNDYSITPTPTVIERFTRAMQPWPICWTKVVIQKESEPKRLQIVSSNMDNEGRLVPDKVQLEGKDEVSWKQFNEGYPNAIFL